MMSHNGRGISNPAALCYMISIIHQLYMMPMLTAHILSLPQEDYPTSALVGKVLLLWRALHEDTGGAPINCLPIWEAMYAHIKGADIYLQKDASDFSSDFLSMLLKELDTGTHAGTIAKDLLSGQLINKLSIADNANAGNRVLEKTERFLTVSVPVHILEEDINLERSLFEFTKKEHISYRWPNIDNLAAASTAIPTIKTIRFQCLPSHLTFHLKRFKFDIKTMRKVKLHNRFEFPRMLDMAPYMSTAPGVVSASDSAAPAPAPVPAAPSRPSTRYRLSGVVIHKGRSASSGHYYSLIRQRGCTPAEDLERAEQWLLFNDHEVTAFDPRDLEAEAFGGPHTRPVPAPATAHLQGDSNDRCFGSVSSAASSASSSSSGAKGRPSTHTSSSIPDNNHSGDSAGFAQGAAVVPQCNVENGQQDEAHLCSESTVDARSVVAEETVHSDPCLENEDKLLAAECEAQLGSESGPEYYSDEEDDYCSSSSSESDSSSFSGSDSDSRCDGSDTDSCSDASASGAEVHHSAFMLYYDRID